MPGLIFSMKELRSEKNKNNFEHSDKITLHFTTLPSWGRVGRWEVHSNIKVWYPIYDDEEDVLAVVLKGFSLFSII